MDRMKWFTGMANGAPAVLVQKDEDESLVLFGDLYRHDQEEDVNLLEPMYSVEFEAIQRNGRMFKLPSGKRDFFENESGKRYYLLPDGEKHDYDWLKTPPATPLFRSLEMEANSSQIVFQRELPILQPVKTSRFSRKPEVASSTPTKSESPTTSSSSKSATPTAGPSSSSKKNLTTTRGSPAFSKDENSAYKIDKRSSYTPLVNRQHNAVAAPAAMTATKAAKKTPGNKPTVPGSTDAAKNIADMSLMKNISVAAPRARSKDPSAGAKDLKVDAGKGGATRRMSRPPAATTGTGNNELNAVAARGRSRGSSEPASGTGARVAEVAAKGRRRTAGEKEQKQQKLGSHAKK